MVFTKNITPPGDAIDNNAVVAMIISNTKYPDSYNPIDPNIPFSVFRYPRGVQVLGVFFTLLSSTYPIHSNQMLAGTISTIIPILIYSVIYLKRKSFGLAAIGLFFMFLIPSGEVIDLAANDFTLGNFINGTLSQHLIVLEFIGFFSFIIFFETINIQIKLWLKLLIFSLFGFAIFITNYSMVFFIIIFIIVDLVPILLKKIYKKVKNREYFIIFFIILSISICLFFLIFIYPYFFSIINNIFHVEFERHIIESSFFISNIFGLIILTSTIIPVLKIITRERWNSSQKFFVISLFLVFILYFFPAISNYLFIRPDRIVIPIAGLSIITLFSFKQTYDFKKYNYYIANKHQKGLDLFTFFIILITTSFSLTPYFEYSEQPQWLGLTEDEYKVITWINLNVDYEDLILNDPSFSGLFLTSFYYRNVVFFRQLSIYERDDGDLNNTMYAKRIHDSMKIFKFPLDFNGTRTILEKYNISFIFISSYNVYYNYFIRQYEQRSNYTSDILIGIYNSNPYLTLEYREGNSAVFMSNI